MLALTRRDEDPRVLPGSLIILRRKCGKATCRCATGAPHESPALSYSVAGRTKILTLAAEEVPAVDAALNLPVERHSHGLRRLAAVEASRGSYDGAVEAIERACGQQLAKRQVEDLARRAAPRDPQGRPDRHNQADHAPVQ